LTILRVGEAMGEEETCSEWSRDGLTDTREIKDQSLVSLVIFLLYVLLKLLRSQLRDKASSLYGLGFVITQFVVWVIG
jgi:hypothetical protein